MTLVNTWILRLTENLSHVNSIEQGDKLHISSYYQLTEQFDSDFNININI